MNPKQLIRRALYHLDYQIESYRPRNGPRLSVLPLVIGDLVRRRSHESPGPGWVVQVGANDGVRNDPVHASIRELGLPALLIEPQPELFEALRETYADQPQVICENMAIAEEPGESTLWRLDPSARTERLSLNGTASFNRDHVTRFARLANLPDSAVQRVRVPADRLAALIEKHSIADILLLLIDVEGLDDRVLLDALADGLRPAAIQWEHVHLSSRQQWRCRARLGELGYRLMDHRDDCIAVHRDALTHRTSPVPHLLRESA